MKNLLFILILGISVGSCKKDCDPKATRNFEVHGYLINRQDSSPITGSLTVNFRTKNSWRGGCDINIIAGEGYSDSTGRFEIPCRYYGASGYSVNGHSFPPPPSNKSVVDLDTIYR